MDVFLHKRALILLRKAAATKQIFHVPYRKWKLSRKKGVNFKTYSSEFSLSLVIFFCLFRDRKRKTSLSLPLYDGVWWWGGRLMCLKKETSRYDSMYLGGPRDPLSSLSLSSFPRPSGHSCLPFSLGHLEQSTGFRTTALGISFRYKVCLASSCMCMLNHLSHI